MGMTAMNLEMALGSMMTQTISPTSWIIGFVRFRRVIIYLTQGRLFVIILV